MKKSMDTRTPHMIPPNYLAGINRRIIPADQRVAVTQPPAVKPQAPELAEIVKEIKEEQQSVPKPVESIIVPEPEVEKPVESVEAEPEVVAEPEPEPTPEVKGKKGRKKTGSMGSPVVVLDRIPKED